MARLTRRTFLKHTLATAATVTIAGTKSSGKVLGANDTIRIAVAGLNGRGESHVDAFIGMKNVEIAYLVDPDKRTYKKRLDQIAEDRSRPEPPTDACRTSARRSKTRNSTPSRSRRRTTGTR